MVIKASAAAEIRLLVEALSGADDVRREAAAARLIVIGGRAVERLLAAYERAASAAARVTILRVLEPIGDPRCLEPARLALKEEPAVAIAATHVLRGLLDSGPRVATAALEALVTVALDGGAPRPLRLAAVEMLRELPDHVRAGVADVLGPEAAIEAEVPESPRQAVKSAWTGALDGRLPDRAADLREAVHARAASAPLTSLQKLVDALKTRESAAGDHAAEWRALRGTVHQALALRGSRVALYDLRESLSAATTPLPVSFLSAVHTVGDSTCLEPLAQAYVRAGEDEDWWRQQLLSAFRAVMAREKLTERSAAVKKIAAKWPAFALRGERQPPAKS
jgi:hypothetical protein